MTPSELKEHLKYLGWSQSELAKRLGTTPTTVSRWMNGGKIPGAAKAYVKQSVAIKKLGEE